ncbi:probable cytochrome P450 6a13 [Macrosteles quadrilineatus]|uniref:probable cytochrome P450 6a13 n=1 Tax=Macrosteles quadrilineatus TaxID=74068 RepID=UPI0023E17C66|nr:probable cytochrome P450 6a13 [Macrosteles quadrilineatus]
MLLVILLGLVSLLVIYLHINYRYWTKRGVIQEPHLPIIGNLLDVVLKRKNAGQVYDAIYQKYCNSHDAVGVYELMTPNLLLLNPRLIKQVTTTDFSSFHDNEFYVRKDLDPYLYYDPFTLKGDEWKPVRTSLASLMATSKVKEIFPYMKKLIPQLDDYLDKHQTKQLEAKDELSSLYMMNTASNSIFGVKCNCFTDPDADFRKMGELFVKESLQSFWLTLTFFYLPRIRDFFRIRVLPKKVCDYLENMLQQVVEHRKKNNIKINDIIGGMISKSGDNLFDIVALGVAIFVDGFETTSSVASFALYELAMNPEIQENLYQEIKTSASNSTDIDFETLQNLPYLDKVLKETLRKYALVYNLKRVCTKRCSLNIDGRNVEIEPNTPIIIPFYGVHNDPRYYPDPEVFDPERFADDNADHADVYYPFGNGPRICPGQRFAVAQMKLFVWNIVLKYTIRPTKTTPTKLTFSKNALMLVSEEPLNLFFERRIC